MKDIVSSVGDTGGAGNCEEGENDPVEQGATKYREQSYWEKRFQSEDEYEWLCKFEDVKEYIFRDINFTDRILVLGCGNSTFSADLYDAGYSNVTSVDFSQVVIESMRTKYISSHPALKWVVGDVRDLKLLDSTFDVVIDKACLDALVCDEGDPWNPNEQTLNDMRLTLESVVWVLRQKEAFPHGNKTFISIGFQQPHFRKRYLIPSHADDCDKAEGEKDPAYGWEKNVETFPIESGLGYFYIRCKL